MWVPDPDKMIHFAGGSLLALVGMTHGWVSAAVMVVVAAVGREAYNRMNEGKFDWRDIVATLLGGAVMLAGGYLGLDGL